MRRVTLRSLWEHKRRLVSTVLAVVLGVSFMSGTLVLADTIDRTFDDLFADINEDVDAQVQGEEQFSSPFGDQARELLDVRLVDEVESVDGVAAASPFVQTPGFGTNNRLVAPDGDVLGPTNGPPTLLESWIDAEAINPYTIEAGRPPEADDEVALNVAAAEDADVELGDSLALIGGPQGEAEYELVGTFTFGRADSAAGAVSADFTLEEAQRIAGIEGETHVILVAAVEAVPPEVLVDRIDRVLPDGAEVITGEQAAEQTSEQVTQFVELFSRFLLIFAAIALVVGIFIIYNTFSILVAQRTRELALLRTLGASRRQVLRSVILEALVVGLVSASTGLLAGVGLALFATWALDAAGLDLPSAGLAVSSSTITTALVTGVLVTVVAAVLPAVRATRVAPLAALRDVAIDRSGASRARVVIGIVVLVLGTLGLAQAWVADGDTDVIPTVGLGALLVVIGAIVVGPVMAGPSVRLIGAPLRRLRGITGNLAVENAVRSPKRTALTASALIIGVALIGFISVFGASARASVTQEVDRGFLGEYVIQAESSGFGPPSSFPTSIADRAARVDGVAIASGLGFGQVQFTLEDGSDPVDFVTAIEPDTAAEVLGIRMDTGQVADLTDDGILVDTQVAEDRQLEVGDTVEVTGTGGRSATLTVEGISDDTTLLGFWTITRATFREVTPQPADAQVVIGLEDGADPEAVRAELEEITDEVPGLSVLDEDEFRNDLVGQITAVLNFIQVLLLLSVVVAMVGIANTLSLSIQERTRELGLMRAVGMTRGQLKATIRYEAVLIAVLGSVVGLALGIVLSRALVEALSGFGFDAFRVPVGSLVLYTLIAAGLAVLASVLPARRAARLDVLDAIAFE